MMKPEKTAIAISALGVVGVLIFLAWGKEIKDTVDEKVFSLTYQFFLFALLGGGLSYFFRELSVERQLKQDALLKKQEKRSIDNKRLREIHSELLGAYNKAKKVRRILRAKAVIQDPKSKESEVLLEQYDQQMEHLMDAQLVFETYAKRIKYNVLWLQAASDLERNLESIESYLNDILKEYQKNRKTFSGEPLVKRLDDLSFLKEFIGQDDDWVLFDSDFKYPIRKVLQALDEAKVV